MAAVAARERVRSQPGRPPRQPVGRWLADHVILAVGVLVLLYMFVPIGYIFALSFNQPSGRSATAEFESFTWNNWTTICQPDGLCDSLKLSLGVSATATVIATVRRVAKRQTRRHQSMVTVTISDGTNSIGPAPARVDGAGKWSVSGYRRGTNWIQGYTNVGDFAGTFGVGIGDRAEACIEALAQRESIGWHGRQGTCPEIPGRYRDITSHRRGQRRVFVNHRVALNYLRHLVNHFAQ